MLQSLFSLYRRWSDLRRMEAELMASSDRELADIGINRSDIAELLRRPPSVSADPAGCPTSVSRQNAA